MRCALRRDDIHTWVFWRLTLCIARAICLVNSVIKNLSFGWLAHSNSKLLEQSIHLQRRLSYAFFEPYTCLYHESWHGVLSFFFLLNRLRATFTKWEALQLIYAGKKLRIRI